MIAENRDWAEMWVNRVLRARTGRVVIMGVSINPNNAPTSPMVKAYCSTEKVCGVGLRLAVSPSEVPQMTPSTAKTTMPIKRKIKSILIIISPGTMMLKSRIIKKKINPLR